MQSAVSSALLCGDEFRSSYMHAVSKITDKTRMEIHIYAHGVSPIVWRKKNVDTETNLIELLCTHWSVWTCTYTHTVDFAEKFL